MSMHIDPPVHSTVAAHPRYVQFIALKTGQWGTEI